MATMNTNNEKTRVYLKFERFGPVSEAGGIGVDVYDPTDWDEIMQEAHAKNFSEFVVTHRAYDANEAQWSFGPFDEENDEEGYLGDDDDRMY